MKKVFLMPLALLSALLLFVSCETDSGSNESESKLVITLDKTSYTYSSSNPKLKLQSDEYASYKDKLYIVIDNDSAEEEGVEFSLTKNDKRTRWDLELTGVNTKRTCEYTLYYGTDENQTIASMTKLTFKVVVGSDSTIYATPTITTQPVGKEYNNGETADDLTVEASISDNSQLKYQWYKNGSAISGATDSSYQPTEAGKYYVRVSNSKNSNYYVDSDTVSITFINPNLAAPTITLNSRSADYVSSSAAELSATITGVSGTLHVQWYKNGAKFEDEQTSTESTYTSTVTSDGFTTYYVVAWNEKDGEKSGYTTSEVITISESAIVITITPSWTGEDVTLGTTLSVTATTKVDCTISYQWYQHDSQSSSDVPDTSIGATSNSFTPTAAGTYFCRVTASSKSTGTQKITDSGKCYVKSKTSDETGTGGFNINFGS